MLRCLLSVTPVCSEGHLSFQTGRAVMPPPSHGPGGSTQPSLFTYGPSQRDHAPSVWQMPIPSQLHGFSAGSSQISAPNRTQGMSNTSGCASSGGFSGRQNVLDRPLTMKDAHDPLSLNQGISFDDNNTHETGFRTDPLMHESARLPQDGSTMEPPLQAFPEDDVVGFHPVEPMSPEHLFPEEFLDGE